MKTSYSFRLYPTQAQKTRLSQVFGSCRYVYNRGLDIRSKAWKEENKNISTLDIQSMLPIWKKDKDTAWLKEMPSMALQCTNRNLGAAFENFFRSCKNGGKSRYPQFKKRHGRQSYQDTTIKLHPENSTVYLPKVGYVKCIYHRTIEGEVCTTKTVSVSSTGKYYIAVVSEFSPKPKKKTGKTVGIDLGIADFAILSDGTKVSNPKWFRSAEKKLALEQRRLSRKPKGSNDRARQRLKVARVHEKIASKRKDWINNFTAWLTSEYDIIVIEDLAIQNMQHNRHLSKSIADASWGEFRRQLEYKCEWYGKELVVIDRFFPSSKTCSACGYKLDTLPLSVREWVCPECGAVHDRDINAAKNICTVATTGIYGSGEDVRQ